MTSFKAKQNNAKKRIATEQAYTEQSLQSKIHNAMQCRAVINTIVSSRSNSASPSSNIVNFQPHSISPPSLPILFHHHFIIVLEPSINFIIPVNPSFSLFPEKPPQDAILHFLHLRRIDRFAPVPTPIPRSSQKRTKRPAPPMHTRASKRHC